MTTKTTKIHVPEHYIDCVSYVASDGKVFITEEGCKQYEAELDARIFIQSHLVVRSSRLTTFYPEGCNATLYYISSDEDYHFLLDHIIDGKANLDDWKDFGPGFYLFKVDEGYCTHYTLVNLDNYIRLISAEFSSWATNILELVKDISKSTEVKFPPLDLIHVCSNQKPSVLDECPCNQKHCSAETRASCCGCPEYWIWADKYKNKDESL